MYISYFLHCGDKMLKKSSSQGSVYFGSQCEDIIYHAGEDMTPGARDGWSQVHSQEVSGVGDGWSHYTPVRKQRDGCWCLVPLLLAVWYPSPRNIAAHSQGASSHPSKPNLETLLIMDTEVCLLGASISQHDRHVDQLFFLNRKDFGER